LYYYIYSWLKPCICILINGNHPIGVIIVSCTSVFAWSFGRSVKPKDYGIGICASPLSMARSQDMCYSDMFTWEPLFNTITIITGEGVGLVQNRHHHQVMKNYLIISYKLFEWHWTTFTRSFRMNVAETVDKVALCQHIFATDNYFEYLERKTNYDFEVAIWTIKKRFRQKELKS